MKQQHLEDLHHIEGYEDVDFEKDGTRIRGKRYYLSEEIPIGRGVGRKTDKIFLSETKLAQLGFTPAVGDNVVVYYNRYGNVSHIAQVDDLIDLG